MALVAVLLALAWRTTTWESSRADGGSGSAASTSLEPGVDAYPMADRQPAPEVEGTTLDGVDLALSSWIGQVVVINVWGSWCLPCRTETPELVRLARQYDGRGVQFLGIDVRDNSAAARAFVDRFEVPYPSLEDEDGRVLLSLRAVVPTSVVPSTVVIDRRGRVAARIIGAVTQATLDGLLQKETGSNGGAKR